MTAHYVMIGGFLGAGKTTAVARLAQWLRERGRRVGLITNDQGSQLVDSLTLRGRGFAVEEIAGGCFCCRFASLKEAADRLAAAERPDILIAEPVGSCTDLVATVTYPLRRLYGDGYRVAPLSVLVDPVRAARILGLAAGPRFSEQVVYIYRKQLEEADLIVINKADAVEPAALARLDAALAAAFPRARRFAVSARTGAGLEGWFAHLLDARQGAGTAMAVDYDAYAAGEALLGWFNATVAVDAPDGTDGNGLVHDLMQRVAAGLDGAEIAHLKMTLSPDDGSGEIATANLTRSDQRPELASRLSDGIAGAQLVINLRAEAAPERLAAAVEGALAAIPGVRLAIEHQECFRPGRPVPTHRDLAAGAPT
jgi:Ni2+-binding GTPase involved in maturation of urease and hydrogenase